MAFKDAAACSKEEKQRENTALQISDSQYILNTLSKAFRSLETNWKKSENLEALSLQTYAERLLRRSFSAVMHNWTKSRAEIPIYSLKQVYLGAKYLGLLSGQTQQRGSSFVGFRNVPRFASLLPANLEKSEQSVYSVRSTPSNGQERRRQSNSEDVIIETGNSLVDSNP